MATAEAVAAETIMTSEGETQTDPALMLESQPGEGRNCVQTQPLTKPEFFLSRLLRYCCLSFVDWFSLFFLNFNFLWFSQFQDVNLRYK